ncbi:trypsin-like peptidase domain-containing protein [Candidatus Sumerlaeota bacterium]|nr:trypsin-like peptidase domain-containing protein [Candidatus Sumerlaeota bacterium]
MIVTRRGLAPALFLGCIVAGFLIGIAWRGDAPDSPSAVSVLIASAEAAAAPRSARHSVVIDVARQISPAVVTIGLLIRENVSPFGRLGRGLRAFGFTRERRLDYVGSGLVFDQKSLLAPGQRALTGGPDTRYVLTNFHVVRGAQKVFVTLTDGREFEAKVLDADRVVDVVLLELLNLRDEEIPTVKLGDSEEIMIGESVVALGNPFGPFITDPNPTVTVGVVSAVNRSFGLERDQRSGENRVYRNMIQTDASVNPGNSGGPLVNFDGEVIGINTFIIAPGGGSSGINFAIPINRAIKVSQEILIHGKVRQIYLDFEVRSLAGIRRDLRRLRGMSEQDARAWLAQIDIVESDGLLIMDILQDDGPATRAGLSEGDVIVQVQGKDVEEETDLIAEFVSRTAGEKMRMTVLRGGERFETDYVIPAARSNPTTSAGQSR